ncbi:AraC family transcriptional regulator [Devosia sp. Root685]|uniref:AraC family transcriptional regulator n=1 Tax=Devosia sp. Root685 TaxID=1736587 RepID=UPI0006F88360|nr:AraC family transcriptional regulator [Devosia sp. Root685]KRA95090.1 AraC family transcriptional regulator [Devosia sp. Root685]
MLSFSTDDVDPRDRFEQWREVRSKGLFGVTIELPAERRAAFSGSFHAEKFGTAVVSEMTASSYVIRRTEADIARIEGNSLCIGLQVRGPGRLDTGLGRSETIANGDMIINHSDLPYDGTPSTNGGFHFRMLKIPVGDALTLGRSISDLAAAKPMEGTRTLRPLRALLDVLTTDKRATADPERDIVHIVRLGLAARGRLAESLPEVRSAIRAGLRYLALDIMAAQYHQIDLTPALVARSLGLSVRHLHLLFEDAEHTFSRTLVLMRVAEARRLFLAQPQLSVSQVAYACGFESIATFYRVFRSVYDMAPGDARQLS